jgi:exodeoxyribonuclease VII large subunit
MANIRQFDLFGPSAKPESSPRAPEPQASPVASPPAAAPPSPHVAPPVPPAVPESVRSRVLTVGELTRQIKTALEDRYQRVAVQGEISNLSRPSSGHFYFTLKDAEATLSAVLFRNQARLMRFELAAGQQVVCKGRLTLYEPRGQYQLAVESVEPVGLGALAVAFDQLKAKLSAEGLFDAARKRPVPVLPRRIGVVTSPSGAAIRDFLRVLHHRFPNLPVLIAPTRVQGEGAGAEVASALKRLCAWSARQPAGEGLDVVLLTRGGGSLEDLWAFNEEVLARAIASASLPVVSAVGHEVDFTIADFVADLRCPTPTAAGERLAPERVKELEQVAVRRRRLHKAMERAHTNAHRELLQLRQRVGDPRREIGHARLALDHGADRLLAALRKTLDARGSALAQTKEQLHRAHPREQLLAHERSLRQHRDRLHAALARALAADHRALGGLRDRLTAHSPRPHVLRCRNAVLARGARLAQLERSLMTARHRRFDAARARLDALSPLKVMSRGYAIAFGADGHVVRRADELAPGDALRVRLPDQGEVLAQVASVKLPSVE